jgi:hypothetical protein
VLLSPGEESIHVENLHVDDELQQFVLSEEVQDVITGTSDILSNKGAAELTKYEEISQAFIARQRALAVAAAPATSQSGFVVHSITPKVQPHKVRVKKPSHFKQSPFEGSIKVTNDQEEVYQKLMLSNKHQRNSKSNIKKYYLLLLLQCFYVV